MKIYFIIDLIVFYIQYSITLRFLFFLGKIAGALPFHLIVLLFYKLGQIYNSLIEYKSIYFTFHDGMSGCI